MEDLGLKTGLTTKSLFLISGLEIPNIFDVSYPHNSKRKKPKTPLIGLFPNNRKVVFVIIIQVKVGELAVGKLLCQKLDVISG